MTVNLDFAGEDRVADDKEYAISPCAITRIMALHTEATEIAALPCFVCGYRLERVCEFCFTETDGGNSDSVPDCHWDVRSIDMSIHLSANINPERIIVCTWGCNC